MHKRLLLLIAPALAIVAGLLTGCPDRASSGAGSPDASAEVAHEAP